MAKIEITRPGERIVEDFTALVPQPTSPSTARAPDVGLVELSYVTPTELVPGPPGPPGPAGSRWYTGVGDPTIPGKLGDMYLDDVTGAIWTYNGVAWVMTGTDLSPDASELLLKIKTVDGSGSGLDADTLDGHDGTYYLDYDNLTDKPSTFPPTLPIAQSDVTGLVAGQAAQDAAINLKAPIASPAFTGNPTAPTPSAGDSDTSLATTAFVQSTVATAVGGVNPFPEAPVDGLTYGRKNAAWATIVGGAVVSDLAPGGPLQNGQLWFKSNSGDTYIWVDDGNSQQWVQQNLMPPATIPSNYITATAQTRNRIVNGAMQISQEWGNTLIGGGYPSDQWSHSFSTTGAVTAQRVQTVTPNKSRDRLQFKVVTADTSLATGELWVVEHRIEGVRIADFGWGTTSARQIVVRFGFKGPAGTYSIAVRNGSNARSYLAAFVIGAGQANTDTEQTFIVPGDTTGTWTVDTTMGLSLAITFASGSTYSSTAGWQAGNFVGVTGASNGLGVINNTFELYDVGLYLDPLATGVAPRWEMPDEAQELAACQRYWHRFVQHQNFTASAVAQTLAAANPWPATMRTAPTIVMDAAGGATNATSATCDSPTIAACRFPRQARASRHKGAR
jgi:hypothetical protein